MPYIASVSTFSPPNSLNQDVATEFSRELFSENFNDIDRLLKVFSNGEIMERQFAVPLSWFEKDHSLQERNDLYIELASEYGASAVASCLHNTYFLSSPIDVSFIDAIIVVSSSGIATPSLDAIIMNKLNFSANTKRIPLWGLGCAGGASGIARGYDFCKAYPKANVLVVCIELCSLTFQKNDLSKSNLIGTSLFADGTACALIIGDESSLKDVTKSQLLPEIKETQSTLMANSLDVMGWDVKNNGLHVVFSRDIPNIIKAWLRPNIDDFLQSQAITLSDIDHFIAHPGGKKVIDAYIEALGIQPERTSFSKKILREHGNMSSPTVLFVLKEVMMQNEIAENDFGLMAALGPGFSSELLLLQWKGV